MKRRADIYFVLYLTAIISFFVVENQVKEYKRETNKLINRLAFREKLVTIQNASARVSKDTVIAELSLNGDFDKKQFRGTVSFRRKIDSAEVKKIRLENSGDEDMRYIAKVPNAKKTFGEKDTLFLVASMTLKPIVTENVRRKWRAALDTKTSAELEKRITAAGLQELNETIQETFNIVLNDEKTMPDLPFILSVPSSSINVLSGMEWQSQLAISGVPSPNDYDIEILKGKEEYSLIVKKELVQVLLSGRAKGSGEIKLRAKNHINGKISEASFAINIRTPRFIMQNSAKAFTGDLYTFDGRLEAIPETYMKVSVSGIYNKEQEGGVIQDIPLTQPGQLIFSVFVNDRKVESRDFHVTVVEPPPPDIKYISLKNNVVTLEIQSYGKVNGQPNSGRISMFISGARDARKVGERVVGFTTITTIELPLQPPREGNRIHVELRARDLKQKESKTFVQDQAAGGHGTEPSYQCLPPGMPRAMLVYTQMEVVITPPTTYILIDHINDNRRIFTDGRNWPKEIEPSFRGYSIGRWIDRTATADTTHSTSRRAISKGRARTTPRACLCTATMKPWCANTSISARPIPTFFTTR